MVEGKTRVGVGAMAVGLLLFTLGSNGVRNLVGWPAFWVIAAALLVGSVVMIVRVRPRTFRWYRFPKALLLFLGLALVSIAWSQYRPESVLGVVLQLATTAAAAYLAFVTTWQEYLRSLATALRWLLAGSLLFELVIAIFVRAPVLPLGSGTPTEDTPRLLLWSRDLLFEGGPIQGLVGSSTLLGFLALLGLIVFGVQFAARAARRPAAGFWFAVALAVFALTRPATVLIGAVVVAAALGFALWARAIGPDRRRPLYATAGGLAVVTIAAGWFLRDTLLATLGKSADLTGRVEIWETVTALAWQHPWFGWGWMSYWAPWAEPFRDLLTIAGVPVTHAHNAWLDTWLQLGFVGLALLAALAASTLWRAWFRAVDRPEVDGRRSLPYAISTLAPLLLLVALLVQSLSESRMLVEGGWVLLVSLAIKLKTDGAVPSVEGDAPVPAWRDVPVR